MEIVEEAASSLIQAGDEASLDYQEGETATVLFSVYNVTSVNVADTTSLDGGRRLQSV